MNYKKIVEKQVDIDLSFSWKEDVQKLIAMALHENGNNPPRAVNWLKRINTDSRYESAVLEEANELLQRRIIVRHREDKSDNKVENLFYDVPEPEDKVRTLFDDILKNI